MKTLIFSLLMALSTGTYAQLSTKFPGEVVGYKPIGKPDCQSMNMTGMPPMNTCEQKYSNGKLTITVSIIEYPKGNPTIVAGPDQGDDQEAGGVKQEKLSVNGLTGHATYTAKTKFADVSLQKSDKLTVSVSGQGQPNSEAVKAIAKALKL